MWILRSHISREKRERRVEEKKKKKKHKDKYINREDNKRI